MEYRVWMVQTKHPGGRVESTACDTEEQARDLVAFRTTCGEDAYYWEL